MRTSSRTLVSTVVLAVALWLFDIDALMTALSDIQLGTFILATALIQLSFIVAVSRWRNIVASNIKLPFLEHLRIYFWSLFYNSFTPANLGGDVYRIGALKPHSNDGAGPVLSGILKERLCGLFGFFSAYVVCLGLCVLEGGQFRPVDPLFSLACIGMLFGIVAIRYSHKLFDFFSTTAWIKNAGVLKRACDTLMRATLFDPNRTTPATGLVLHSYAGVLIWLAGVLVVANDFELGIPFSLIAAIALLTELARYLPISIQGIGIREGTFAALVGLAGGSAEAGFVVAAIAYLSFSVVLVLSGAIAAFIRPLELRNTDTTSDTLTTP